MNDTLAVYFLDVTIASAFVARWRVAAGRSPLLCCSYLDRRHLELVFGRRLGRDRDRTLASYPGSCRHDGNCSTEYVSTGGALRRAAASRGGILSANFVMLSVPPKVDSDATRIPRHWPVSSSGLFEG